MISCTMPTRGHIFPARFAIEAFQRQSYPNRELVVVCKTPGSEVGRYLAALADPNIRFFETPDADTVGDLRNRALSQCRGSLICVWDDDDLYGLTRLEDQLAAMLAFDSPACFLQREILWWPSARRLAVSKGSIWENSMLASRDAVPAYPSLTHGEDTAIVTKIFAAGNGILLDAPRNYIRVYHGANSWDAGHFERFFDRASLAVPQEDYDARFDRIAASQPLRAYLEGVQNAPNAPARP